MPFSLLVAIASYIGASNYLARAVLLQESVQKIDHPISYFSQKFDQHQCNYSTCEKEILLMIQPFDFIWVVPSFLLN